MADCAVIGPRFLQDILIQATSPISKEDPNEPKKTDEFLDACVRQALQAPLAVDQELL
jgi:hypothetical protein